MQHKHEWRKHEKSIYLPKVKPEIIDVPAFNFLSIKGKGHPNSPDFQACVEALYALSYGIKMQLKQLPDLGPDYNDFTVYPLEGVWDISDKAKLNFDGHLDKNELVYTMMIRQPSFVSPQFVVNISEQVKEKKKLPLISSISFESVHEGSCIQMLHLGPFDDEPQSFAKMEEFAFANGLQRQSKVHREIYLSDPRRVSPDKYKTVLRFQTV